MVDSAFRQIIAQFRSSKVWDEELDLRLLKALWPGIAGPSLARNISVLEIRGEDVVLGVPDRTWQRQLMSMRPLLLKKLNEPWSGHRIRRIRFSYEDYSR